LRKEIDTDVDVEIEYNATMFRFQLVPVSGYIVAGPATEMETSWSEIKLHVNITPEEVSEWMVEHFEDRGFSAPSWAYTEGKQFKEAIVDYIENLEW
jgi:hypothetical protein